MPPMDETINESNHLSRNDQFLREVNDIIESNLRNDKFGVEDLAEAMAMSRIQLYRKLHKLTCKNISQYIREFRLQKAMELLKEDVANVAETGYQVGFSSPAYFNKCFHDYYGIPPGEIVKKQEDKHSLLTLNTEEDGIKDEAYASRKWKRRVNNYKRWILIGVPFLIIFSIASYFLMNLNDFIPSLDHERTVAVLPFRNDSPDPENNYFCRGMEEEIRTQLMKIADLKILGRQSVEKYHLEISKNLASIGSELKVSYIVTGSVRKIADDIRVYVQLYEASTEHLLWANEYNGKYTDKLLAFQSDNAIQIVLAVNGVINPIEQERIKNDLNTDISAYDYAVRGQEELRDYWQDLNTKHLKNAHILLDKALAIDSVCLRAVLCKANVFSATSMMISHQYDSAIFFYEKAKKIDPYNPEIYMNLGNCYRYMRESDLAIENLATAINLNFGSFWSHLGLGRLYCEQKKDYRSGLPHLYQSIILNEPVLPETVFNVGMSFYHMQFYDKAEEYFSKAMELQYGCMGITYYSSLLYNQGKFGEALEFLDSICTVNDCNNQCNKQYFYNHLATENYEEAAGYLEKIIKSNNPGVRSIERLFLHEKQGNSDEKFNSKGYYEYYKKVWSDKPEYPGLPYVPLNLAEVCALLERNAEALKFLLEFEAQPGIIVEPWIQVHPIFINLREDPDFNAIFERAEIKREKRIEKIRFILKEERINL